MERSSMPNPELPEGVERWDWDPLVKDPLPIGPVPRGHYVRYHDLPAIRAQAVKEERERLEKALDDTLHSAVIAQECAAGNSPAWSKRKAEHESAARALREVRAIAADDIFRAALDSEEDSDDS